MCDLDNSPAKIAEYSELKNEQRERIKIREQLYFISFAIYGSLGAYALKADQPGEIWLILSFVAAIVGHLFLENETKISSARDFLKKHYSDVLLWETHIDTEAYRGLRKFAQTCFDVSAFVLPSFLGIVLACQEGLTVFPKISFYILPALSIYVAVRIILRSIHRYL